ncbi:hypothetical protein MFLAVUS_003891 [Mucor flavus]|uniref:VPS4-associated protein 1 n=1 Tax=Mucor flavus TaxID=439312 RepID=A0ABP9YUH0_9FUNG
MSSIQRLQNLYIARLTTQERPCFICNKFTGVVLTSADNSNADWFYICRSHLGDFNFCTKVGGPKVKSPIEAKKQVVKDRPVESDSVVELVSSIGSAWKSWRAPKKSEEDGKNDKKEEEEKKEEKEEKKEEPTSAPTSAPTSPTTQQPIRFIIQKDYFYLRQREYQKKKQTKEATAKLKTLQFPEVPQTLPTLK